MISWDPELEKALLDFAPGITKESIIEAIHQKPGLFEQFWSLAMNGTQPAAWRAAWVADSFDEKYPGHFTPHLHDICDRVVNEKHDGLRRAMLRILLRYPIPEELEHDLMEVLFRYLFDGKTASDKVLPMKILFNMTKKYPELDRELYDSIEMQLDLEGKAFVSAGNKIMTALRKRNPGLS